MKNFVAHIHYTKDLTLKEKLVFAGLGILTPFYTMGAKVKLFLFKKGMTKSQKVNAFVISIGNITTGGTGKTPVCVAIANYFSKILNKKTAILSRGYGGKLSNKNINTISDGENIFFGANMSGDEPYWLACNAPKTSVFTCKDRVKSAQYAIKNHASEVLILDDGFQHIRLHRDLNLMLVDGNLKFGNEKLLPQGPLREPISEISRADVILVMNKRGLDDKAKENCQNFAREVGEKYHKKAIVCNFAPQGIYSVNDASELLGNSKIYAFAGVGQPKFFFEYLENQGHDLLKKKVFSDHYSYTKDDIENIIMEAQNLGANSIVTTEKDLVKIKSLIDNNSQIRFYALKLGIDLNINEILPENFKIL